MTTFKVRITYKSGKVEETKIAASDYSDALVKLADEGRLVKMEIVGVE